MVIAYLLLKRGQSRLARHPDELGTVIPERTTVEPAVERFRLEPGDVEQPLPFAAPDPPERDRGVLVRDVDAGVSRVVVQRVDDAVLRLCRSVELGGDLRIEDESVPGEASCR